LIKSAVKRLVEVSMQPMRLLPSRARDADGHWQEEHPVRPRRRHLRRRTLSIVTDQANLPAALSRTEQRVTLRDGRTLGFAEYGDPSGEPVLEFHGWPSCRTEAWMYDKAGKKLGARVIGIDRPGFGLSTYKKGYRVTDWPSDVKELADALGFNRFAVLGISSGSAYALACARFIPERLTACAIVGGVSPLKVEGEKLKRYVSSLHIHMARMANSVPLLAQAGFWYICWLIRNHPEYAMRQLVKGAPALDLELLQDDEVKRQYQHTVAECSRGGTKGPTDSAGLEVKDWGFRLENIKTHVTLWHGELDTLVSPSCSREMAAKLPNHSLHIVADYGHPSLIARYADEVLRSCLPSARARASTPA
jgi:pimeloyl-ACP methyl ester carboxylesterase